MKFKLVSCPSLFCLLPHVKLFPEISELMLDHLDVEKSTEALLCFIEFVKGIVEGPQLDFDCFDLFLGFNHRLLKNAILSLRNGPAEGRAEVLGFT